MKTSIRLSAALILGCYGVFAHGLDASGQRYTQMLASGGPGSISRAAQDIFNTNHSDPEVLDVAAQVLSEFYLKSPDTREYADATAWLCKALGSSGNGRYKSLIETVTAADIHRKTRKHCEKAGDSLPAGVAPFQPGSVNLARYRDGGAAVSAPASAAAPSSAKSSKAATAAPAAKTADFSQVKEGMSMQEVDALIGTPTNQTTYMTGKAFVPFNFGAKDVQRVAYFYKGAGRIVFSLKSAYNGVYRVVEIIPNPDETGYP
jgi:hypothetical protein